jgi:ribonuclease BN (tRNA processing enzyme)
MSPLAVTVLGSSGMFATPERACAGYLLELSGSTVLLDAGSGVWQNLLAHVDYRDVDGVVLSHRHPDHVTDVFQMFHARRYGDPDPLSIIPLWAPAETLERAVAFIPDLEEAFELRTVADGDETGIADATARFVRMAHPPETLGVRIQHDGAVLSYSADTGPDADFERLARGADLFVCEATFQDSDEEWEGHMSASQAGTVAGRESVSKLLLTHLRPGRDPALSLAEAQRTAGEAEVQLASDGLRLEVG